MYYNLLANESRYKKFISIGSGAELFAQQEPYGLSKHVINYSMRNKTNFHNVRIFAVFDENELDSRFIKSSILKYLNDQPIEIHQNKLMDFFYMKDLIKLMEYCISAEDLPKEINCSYKNIYHLKDIARIINTMDDNKVPVNVVNKKEGVGYVGTFTNLGIDYIGIEQGIENVFNELKKKNDKAN
jgi:nucleoside-diphosphate-sugar epimerase